MQTIQASVNPKLLTKANRFFTGTVKGRIIELLQNARRAGATRLEIHNREGVVTVHDDGTGIDDFAALLDMGGSAWDALEASEDPAGVGIFCLAPRPVTIRSRGQMAVIGHAGWTGVPVDVDTDTHPCSGTIFEFKDEPWSKDIVEPFAVFSGLNVVVDNERCAQGHFVGNTASHHEQLGCRIEVRTVDDLNRWHRSCRGIGYRTQNVLVNFHGQVVASDCRPDCDRPLCVLVDLTGEATDLRLMLPARTQLVQNDALTALKDAIQMEVFRYLHRVGKHALPYKQYLYARERGIDLPEAVPTYSVGLLSCGDVPEPVRVDMPEGFSLAGCYRMDDGRRIASTDETNAHLLAALGTLDEPFVPVSIRPHHLGYSWAKLPTITSVQVRSGKALHRDAVWAGELVCVDTLAITVRTSDGRVFSSQVCMAAVPRAKNGIDWAEDCVLVTPDAETQLRSSELWYQLGGFSEDADSYETQEYQFEQELNAFWSRLHGPDEQQRRDIMEAVSSLTPAWQSVRVQPDGHVRIRFADRTTKTIAPPLRSRK